MSFEFWEFGSIKQQFYGLCVLWNNISLNHSLSIKVIQTNLDIFMDIKWMEQYILASGKKERIYLTMFLFLLLMIICSKLVHSHSAKLSVHYDVKESICVATYSDGSGNSHTATHSGPKHITCSTLSSIENTLKRMGW